MTQKVQVENYGGGIEIIVTTTHNGLTSHQRVSVWTRRSIQALYRKIGQVLRQDTRT